MKVQKLFEIDHLAQEFMEPPRVIETPKKTILMFDFETDTGEYTWTGVTFLESVAYKVTRDMCANRFMIIAYNSVVEVIESDWIEQLRVRWKGIFNLRHFMVYFDGYGCYELFAGKYTKAS